MEELGLEEAKHKSTAPATSMKWLGIHFDTISMIMAIPQEKIREIHKMVVEWRGRKKCTKKQLNQLLGKLYFAASCNDVLRLFTN